MVHCFIDPCQVAECDVEGAECVSDYCGGCNAVWLADGREVCQTGALIGVYVWYHSKFSRSGLICEIKI